MKKTINVVEEHSLILNETEWDSGCYQSPKSFVSTNL